MLEVSGVSNEAAIGLVNELATRLSGIVEEFGRRTDSLVAASCETDGPDEETLIRIAGRLIDQRKRRRNFLPDELFHEPAWDMLLSLFVAYRRRQTLNIKSLVSTADAPVTTSQRWIEHLDKLGLITRVIDPADRRRIEVSLNESGHNAMTRYLEDVARRQ